MSELTKIGGLTLAEAYDVVQLGSIVSSKVVYVYAIECQWESDDKQHCCIERFVVESEYPLSNFQVYEKSADAGYTYENGRVVCGCHGVQDE